MKMDKVAQKLFEAFTDANAKEVRVGRVDLELVKEMERLQEAHAKQHEELKARIEAFIDQVHAEHKPECDEHERKIADVWERIYDAVGIPDNERDEDYSLDRISGVVTKKVLPDRVGQAAENKGGSIH